MLFIRLSLHINLSGHLSTLTSVRQQNEASQLAGASLLFLLFSFSSFKNSRSLMIYFHFLSRSRSRSLVLLEGRLFLVSRWEENPTSIRNGATQVSWKNRNCSIKSSIKRPGAPEPRSPGAPEPVPFPRRTQIPSDMGRPADRLTG